MNDRSKIWMLAACALVWACGASSGSPSASRQPAPTRSSDVVTMEELSKVSTSSTMYEALRALRPAWFRRNPTTLRPQAEGDIVIYLDHNRLGGPETLRTIQLSAVTAVRYYSPSEAEARFGLGHLHGAIQVITTR